MRVRLLMNDYKKIKRYPEYEINTQGDIRHVDTGRILKPTPSFNGHLRVKLKNKTEYVGRLVAETFIPNIQGYSDIRYKDGDKTNLSVSNIEWASHHKTQYDSFGFGRNAPGGDVPPKRIFDSLTNTEYPSIKACSKATGFVPVKIRYMLKRKQRFKEI